MTYTTLKVETLMICVMVEKNGHFAMLLVWEKPDRPTSVNCSFKNLINSFISTLHGLLSCLLSMNIKFYAFSSLS